ncbi:hypothetical protein BT93_C1651 [Corymbia citriodora subsp. variegata]|nr:hypothetical protein BT93_C1651 [Corymbia citriodora subsp. variegata]
MDDVSGEEYDVFLSFRGSDTRLNFTDCLYCSLIRAGIHVFLDSEELELGEKINEVLNAMNKSQIYIPIFSKNFTSSIWCLREVKHMVERHSESNGKKKIIPIFYDVKTDDVKLRTNLYKKAILKHKKMKKLASKEVQQWESALKTVGKIIGLELQDKRQGEEIESIVEVASRKLNTRERIVPEHLVKDNAQLEAIMKLLDVGSDGVCFVGVHGMGGIGKTTLTTVLYNKLSLHFEGCCFLQDVRVHWQPPSGPLDLQKKLLLHFVNSSIIDQIKDVDAGTKMIKRVLCKKRVLIVLDDLDNKEQFEKLAGKSDWFGSGSRIIITTRDERIFTAQVESSCKENQNHPKEISRYAVRVMEFDQALQLFYKHVFRSHSPVDDYNTLSKAIVCKVDRLPLAVEVIGSHLYNLGFAKEKHGDKIKLLKETLQKLHEGPFKDVQRALMISYEGLEKNQKEIFLDIACFFSNENKRYPIIMWDDCKYQPHTEIRVLRQLSLIKIRDDKFWMHDQVRDFGRDIIRKVHTPPFSRVWEHKEAVELLQKKEVKWMIVSHSS